MNINITMLNVKDGDAIIVHLQKKDADFVLLIDGGETQYGSLVIKALDKILASIKKEGPDLIVCTHYDSDHIGGLKNVIKYYSSKIGEIWIHRTQALLDLTKVKMRKLGGGKPKMGDRVYRSIKKTDTGLQKALESIKQETQLLELIDSLKIPNREPLYNPAPIKDWPEISIMGPTLEYYLKLFPKKINRFDFLSKEYHTLKNNKPRSEAENPCETLNKLSLKSVTAPNLCSAIIMIKDGDKKFLFTADGGLPSFENVPDFKEELKDIFWLKVPHHASSNNISCNLIDLMNPAYAYISGDQYVCPNVVKAFNDRNVKLKSTKEANDHIYFSYPVC